MNSDALVVGAGPVGLLLAGELRLGGIDVAVHDGLSAPNGQSRALGFNRRAAESLDQRGLLSRLGHLRWGPMGHFGGVPFDLNALDEDQSGVLGLSQARTEEVLGDWLAELGVPVRRGHAVTGFRETPDGVVVAFDGRCDETTRYLVGCDGAGSTVRRMAGIEATGWESTRGMITAEITGVRLRPRPIGERLPGGNMVVCTPLGEAHYRIVIHDSTLPLQPDPHALTFTYVADAWQRLTGESIHDAQELWLWGCGNATRVADEYRRGRVFLCGDAAHEVPPMAAWGLSTGLQDAVNLGWKLAATINGWAPEHLLDTYQAERHPLGAELARNARAASELRLNGEEMDPVRGILAELVTHKEAAEHLAGIVSGLGIRYDVGAGEHPLLGRRMPIDLELALPGGTGTRIAHLLHSAHGLLITNSDEAEKAAQGWAERITIVRGSPGQQLDAVLVRPDGYVAWSDPGADTDLSTALTHWFGDPGAQV